MSRCAQIIHWEIPNDSKMYVQESGRAGCDGDMSCALLVFSASDLGKKYASEQMIKYCKNSTQCRKVLFADFEGCQDTR